MAVARFILPNTFALTAADWEVVNELLTQSDRGLGVLGGALVADALTLAISCKWRFDATQKNVREARDLLLKDGGVLSFGVNIELAFLSGLIGPTVHADLKALKGMRNDFSHVVEVTDSKNIPTRLTFATPTIAARCKNLKLVDSYDLKFNTKPIPNSTAKDRYLATSVMLYVMFLLYAYAPNKEPKIIDTVLKS